MDRARGNGAAAIGMPTPAGSAGARLMCELGYTVRWTSWILRLAPGAVIAAQPLPAGYWQVRVATAPSSTVRGAVWLTMNDDHCWVGKLAVRSDQRHRGLARALLADASPKVANTAPPPVSW